MRSPSWPAWFILPANSDSARVSSTTFAIVLLVCFMRSPPVSSATVPVSGPKDSPAVAALKQSFIDMGTLHDKPADDVVFTTQFVPIKP